MWRLGDNQTSQNIPTVVYSAAGNWKWLAALVWEREGLFGSELGYAVEFRDGQIVTRVAPNSGEEVSMPALGGEVLWEVDVRGDRITLSGEPVPEPSRPAPHPA